MFLWDFTSLKMFISCVPMYHGAVWRRLENSLHKSVLTFQHESHGGWTQVGKLCGKPLYSHLADPSAIKNKSISRVFVLPSSPSEEISIFSLGYLFLVCPLPYSRGWVLFPFCCSVILHINRAPVLWVLPIPPSFMLCSSFFLSIQGHCLLYRVLLASQHTREAGDFHVAPLW